MGSACRERLVPERNGCAPPWDAEVRASRAAREKRHILPGVWAIEREKEAQLLLR